MSINDHISKALRILRFGCKSRKCRISYGGPLRHRCECVAKCHAILERIYKDNEDTNHGHRVYVESRGIHITADGKLVGMAWQSHPESVWTWRVRGSNNLASSRDEAVMAIVNYLADSKE